MAKRVRRSGAETEGTRRESRQLVCRVVRIRRGGGLLVGGLLVGELLVGARRGGLLGRGDGGPVVRRRGGRPFRGARVLLRLQSVLALVRRFQRREPLLYVLDGERGGVLPSGKGLAADGADLLHDPRKGVDRLPRALRQPRLAHLSGERVVSREEPRNRLVQGPRMPPEAADWLPCRSRPTAALSASSAASSPSSSSSVCPAGGIAPRYSAACRASLAARKMVFLSSFNPLIQLPMYSGCCRRPSTPSAAHRNGARHQVHGDLRPVPFRAGPETVSTGAARHVSADDRRGGCGVWMIFGEWDGLRGGRAGVVAVGAA